MLKLNQVAFNAYKTNDINHIYFFLNKGICHCFIFIPSSITYKTSKFLGVFLMSWSSFIKTQSLITPLQLMDFINCFLNIGLIAAFGERTLLIFFYIVSFFFSKFNWIGSASSITGIMQQRQLGCAGIGIFSYFGCNTHSATASHKKFRNRRPTSRNRRPSTRF